MLPASDSVRDYGFGAVASELNFFNESAP